MYFPWYSMEISMEFQEFNLFHEILWNSMENSMEYHGKYINI
jgi:hypothetical protein